jgi:hypothetical protein
VIVRVHSNASIIRDEPPSLGYSEEVMTEEEKIKRAFDSELRGEKKKAEDEEGLDADFNESEWDLTKMSALDIQRACDRLEGKKSKKSPAKIYRDWD